MDAARVRRAALCAALLAAVPAAARPAAADTANLRDWTLARCVTKAAGDQPFGADAKRSAAALLERGTAGDETYERLDALIDRTLATPASGSGGGTYELLQCIDLTHSPALARIIERRRR